MKCCKKKSPIIPMYCGFTDFVPSVPQLYWNVVSNEQRIHAICKELDKLICYAEFLGININDYANIVEELQREFDEFKASGFLDYYEQQLNAWINEHMPEIIAKSVKMVYFGLTLEGYFVAYIPDSWKEIIFDTGMVYGEDTYGRLLLRWDVDNSGESVNQRPENWRD